jgi:hypothetical protein
MARKVFISSSISVDEQLLAVAEQDPLAQLLWPWLLTSLDDWGRGSANVRRLKAAVFPDNPLVTPEVIDRALTLYAAVGLIDLYTVGPKRYWAVKPAAWWRYQTHIHKDKREREASQIPDPPASVAEVRATPRDSADSRGEERADAEPRAYLPPSALHLPPSASASAEGASPDAMDSHPAVSGAASAGPAEAAADTELWPALAARWKDRIGGRLTAWHRERLTAYMHPPDGTPALAPDLIEAALDETALHQPRQPAAYLFRLLDAWRAAGYRTAADRQAARGNGRARDAPVGQDAPYRDVDIVTRQEGGRYGRESRPAPRPG